MARMWLPERRRRPLFIGGGLLALALVMGVWLWTGRAPHTDHLQAGGLSWHVVDSGAGSVTDSGGALTLSPAPAIDSAQTRSAVALVGSDRLSDYSYSLRVATQRLPDNAAPAVVRLLVRYTPTAGGYYVSHSAAGLELGKLDVTRQLVLARSATPVRTLDGSHQYRVDADGGTLRVFVDGELWISYDDPEPVPSGRAGVWIAGTRASVTDAAVGVVEPVARDAADPASEPRMSLAHTSAAFGSPLPTSLPATLPTPATQLAPATLPTASAATPSASPPANGGTVGWGSPAAGVLGGLSTSPRLMPEPIAELDAATALATGRSHSLAVDASGKVWSWGSNSAGQLGRLSASTCLAELVAVDCDPTPGRVPGLEGIVRVAAGDGFSLALKADGTLWAWGADDAGQLGDGAARAVATPVQVQGLDHVIRVAAGHAFGLALEADGTVTAWGANEAGQLGNGTNTASPTPVGVRDLDGIVAIAAGDYFGLGLKSDGSVWAWGADEYGQLGVGAPSPGRNAPVPVSRLGDTLAIAAGGYHALAIDTTGALWGWGANWYGELGLATGETCPSAAGPQQPCSSAPQLVAGLPGPAGNVAAGEFHSLVLLRDGRVWAMGRNADGQLGDGTDSNSARPVQVVGLSSAWLIAAGGQHSLAASPARLTRQAATP